MSRTNRRNAWIALGFGLLIGTLAVIGSCIDDSDRGAPPLPSDGAQFRQWLCTEYDQLIDVGC